MKTQIHNISALLLTTLFLSASPYTYAARKSAKKIDYDRQIRPILARNCFECHGPNRKKRKGRLRLDTKEGAYKDRGGYQAFTPGKPDESEAFYLLTVKDDEQVMPPPKYGKRLKPQQVAMIKKWIEQGAKYPTTKSDKKSTSSLLHSPTYLQILTPSQPPYPTRHSGNQNHTHRKARHVTQNYRPLSPHLPHNSHPLHNASSHPGRHTSQHHPRHVR